jgi:DNA repair protein RadC
MSGSPKIASSADLVALIGPAGDKTREVFGIAMLDKNQRFMGLGELEHDGKTAQAIQIALIGQADSVILLRILPSRTKVRPQPRDADKEMVRTFVDAFAAVDVHLIDFVIVGWDRKTYFSFLDSKMMPLPFGEDE